jgi:lysophospholipase L1-like esterase
MNATVLSARSSFWIFQSNLPRLAPLLLGLFLAGCKSTPAPAPPAQPAPISATPTNAVSPQDSANLDVQHDRTSYQSDFSTGTHRMLPMLFIVGDSTVHNSSGGRIGWGDILGNYFDTNKIRVENHALAGRSSRTFQTQGWWNLVLAASRPGDFVLIQLGHNDGGPLDDTNRARGSLPGIGDETREIYNPVTQKQEVVHTYGWYLRKYISDARSKGMTPVICSPVPHVPKQAVKAGDVEPSNYVVWSGEVATNENAPFIHLNRIAMGRYAGMTPEQIKLKYFTPADNTHTNPAGAELNAASVIEGLRGLVNCPLQNDLALPQSRNL